MAEGVSQNHEGYMNKVWGQVEILNSLLGKNSLSQIKREIDKDISIVLSKFI